MNILLGSTKWLGMANNSLLYSDSSVNGSGWRGWMFIDRLMLMEQIFFCSTIFLLAENGRMGMWIYCGGGGSTMGRLLGRMDRGSESPEHEGKYQKKRSWQYSSADQNKACWRLSQNYQLCLFSPTSPSTFPQTGELWKRIKLFKLSHSW